jgi:hypothetical protein
VVYVRDDRNIADAGIRFVHELQRGRT